MPEVKPETIANAETHSGERLLGKVYIMGAASFTLRALTNEDQMIVNAAGMFDPEPATRLAAVMEMTCRVGIEDWDLHTRDGAAIPIERAKINRDGVQAITVACIRKLPYEVRKELFGEISELSALSADEGLRLDFTIPKRDAATPS